MLKLSSQLKRIFFGYSLTGARNSPASPEATGLEVDKLSRAHVKSYFNNYLDRYKDTVGDLKGQRGLQYVIADSMEVKRNADIPMSAMWVEKPGTLSRYNDADVLESASGFLGPVLIVRSE